MVLALAILLILLEGSYEGFKTRKFYVVSEIIEFVFLALVTTLAFLWLLNITPIHVKNESIVRTLFGYVFLRFALFDLIFNVCAGLGIGFIGTTKLFDKAQSWIVKMWGIGTLWFMRFVALCVSLAFLLNYGQ